VCSALHGFQDLMSSAQVWHEQTVAEARYIPTPLLFVFLILLCFALHMQDVTMPILLLTGMWTPIEWGSTQGAYGTAACH